MNAVVRADESLPIPATDTGSLLEVIRRAAADPSVDMDKMERLLAMKERMDAREAETAFNQALNAAQAEVGRIAADATNPQTHSKYATYAKLDKVLRPIYTRHGFALSFDETDSPKPEHIRVLCHVTHSAGHTKTYQKDMPADGKGAKGGDVMTKTHATGAASSYGARYILKGIFNVAIGEEDRDGNDATEPTLTPKQAADLQALITETGGDIALFKRWAKVDSLEQILAKNYATVCKEVRERAKLRTPK
jgi:hypothetical protein